MSQLPTVSPAATSASPLAGAQPHVLASSLESPPLRFRTNASTAGISSNLRAEGDLQ